jgi:hypothetical protein
MQNLFRANVSPTLIALILISLLARSAEVTSQTPPQEKGAVCLYFKRVDLNNVQAGYYVQLINKHGSSGKFILRLSDDNAKAVFIDVGRTLAANERDLVERNLAARIGDMFQSKNEKLLKTAQHYKELFAELADGNFMLKQADLTKKFDIKDTVYAFNFDAAAQNYAILKDGARPEALVLYQFVEEKWTGLSFYPNYKDRVSKHDFKEFLSSAIVGAIFEEPTAKPVAPELSAVEKRIIADADQKATWAMLLGLISAAVSVFVIFSSLSQAREREEQAKRLEGKIKSLENRLNKPFYQVDGAIDDDRQSGKITQTLLSRLIALEQKIGQPVVQNGASPKSFQNKIAIQLQGASRAYREKWTSDESLATEQAQLALCLDEFALHFSALDDGMPLKDFVVRYAIPHIDAMDGIFQPEPDAPINTPQSVEAYIAQICGILSIAEIEVRAKISRFDNERHEKAGAILKTSLEAGTITKSLRRGLIHGDFVRKAQVIRAE